MSRENIISGIEKEKVISIIRGAKKENFLDVMQALYEGGIKFAEITFYQSGKVSNEETASMIAAAREKFEGRISVGAETVVTAKQTELAKNAGGEFIISPNTDK